MESRLRIAGQAVQPILVMFPLGLFAMAAIFDTADLGGGPGILGTLACWNVVAGLFAGILATLAGAIDLAFVRRADVKRVGVLRVLLNMGSLILFAVILMLRMGNPDRATGVGLYFIELLALAVTGFSAWFASRLAHGRTPAFDRAAAGQARSRR